MIITGNCEPRDIILQKRCTDLKRISETHRSYDALQYPIILWDGQDSYDLNIKLINPVTKLSVDKPVSSMQFYSHRIMVRGEENHLLKCRDLFQQYLTDMYAKIESERLLYIKNHQPELRVDEYIHLRDAINNDGEFLENVLLDNKQISRYDRDAGCKCKFWLFGFILFL